MRKHATRVTGSHDLSPTTGQPQKVGSTTIHVFPLTSRHCPFLFKFTTWLPVEGSTWTLYHPYSARVYSTTLFVTETSFLFKDWYSESLQQRLCTQKQNKKESKKLHLYLNGIKIYIPSCLNLKCWAWRWFLRKQRVLKLFQKTLLFKNMK